MAEQSPASTDELRLHLLVLRCQAGDERAFAGLMDGFGQRTLAYLRGLIGDDADDVQQEVWLAFYRGLRGLNNPGAFRTWLYRTTRHRAIDFLRRRRRERELIEDATVGCGLVVKILVRISAAMPQNDKLTLFIECACSSGG